MLHPEDSSVSVDRKIRPEAGKLIVFIEPISYHNVEEIKMMFPDVFVMVVLLLIKILFGKKLIKYHLYIKQLTFIL